MGKVLIIKNNNCDKRINNYAKQSYEESKKYYYIVRAITDYIAGMTDGYALEEYEKLK